MISFIQENYISIVISLFVSILAGFIIVYLYKLIGIMILFMGKIKGSINYYNVGIKCIYKEGNNVRSMVDAMNESNEIFIKSYMPSRFISNNIDLIVAKLNKGARIKVLMLPPGAQLQSLLTLNLYNNNDNNDNDNDNDKYATDRHSGTISWLNAIRDRTNPMYRNNLEIRYSTEINNPTIICTNGNNKHGYLTISIPPSESINSRMIEFEGKNCDELLSNFQLVWGRSTQAPL